MKKILILFAILFATNPLVFAFQSKQAQENSDFEYIKSNLNLNIWQEKKLDRIENATKDELNEIYGKLKNYRAEALLIQMKAAQLGLNYSNEIAKFQNAIYNLENKADEVVARKDRDIESILYKKQKAKYFEYKSKTN